MNSNKTTGVRIIFDIESQKTYVKNDVTIYKKYLHLPTLQSEWVFAKTIGKCESESATVVVVLLKFIVNGKSIVIKSLCAPYICSDIFGQTVKNATRNYAQLKNIKWADFFDADHKKMTFW